jgi:hypothetical protein
MLKSFIETKKKPAWTNTKQVFVHAGLLINEPADRSRDQTGRFALYLVIRRIQIIHQARRAAMSIRLAALHYTIERF